jgi:Protein of unknown function (DUF4058)
LLQELKSECTPEELEYLEVALLGLSGRLPRRTYTDVYRRQFLHRVLALAGDVWRAHYLRPLPPILIPLASPDPDLTINLQPLVAAVYARSHYDRIINYLQPLHPPLIPSEATWLQERLQQQHAAFRIGSKHEAAGAAAPL